MKYKKFGFLLAFAFVFLLANSAFAQGITGWVKVNGNIYYYTDQDDKLTDSWLSFDGQMFHFDSKGIMQTGIQTIDNTKYTFDRYGALQTGWVNMEGNVYYVKNGDIQTGTQMIGNKTYKFDNQGVLQTGWETIDRDIYYVKEGVIQTGWQYIDHNWYYFYKGDQYGNWKGSMVTGSRTIDNQEYYFNSQGVRQSGFVKVYGDGGPLFYFDSNGVMVTGWQKINKKMYYFDTSKNYAGEMFTGWQTINHTKYYFDSDGSMRTGWQTIKGYRSYRYYFNSDGAMQTGWITIKGSHYYLDTTFGNAYTGFQSINGTMYDFNSSGVMQTGWQTINKARYYFNANGTMRTGFLQQNGKSYYFNTDTTNDNKGKMVVGWKRVGRIDYYFNKDGTMNTTINYFPIRQKLANAGFYDLGGGVGYSVYKGSYSVSNILVSLYDNQPYDTYIQIEGWSNGGKDYASIPDKVKLALQAFLPSTYMTVFNMIDKSYHNSTAYFNKRYTFENRQVEIRDGGDVCKVWIGKPNVKYDKDWNPIKK